MSSLTIVRGFPSIWVRTALIGHWWAIGEGEPKEWGWCLRRKTAITMALGMALAAASRVDA